VIDALLVRGAGFSREWIDTVVVMWKLWYVRVRGELEKYLEVEWRDE
jgi:hypothetical protein